MSDRERPEIPEGTVAVVGMAGRFPGARNLKEYWQNLREGVESIHHFTPEELAAAGIAPALLADPHFVPAASPVPEADRFDAAFFGFNPREAEILDPQHRLLLETAWAALEDAGYDPHSFGEGEAAEALVGVFAGATTSTYLLFHLLANPAIRGAVDPLALLVANAGDSLATRVSYKLRLRGPSYSISSACSTSLVAVHNACQSLLNEECDLALAGGVSVNLSQPMGYLYTPDSILSPDGHCRAFDARARGTVFGSGVGLVVLKRVEDALADGDTIRALILGSAVNNDGGLKVGYTAPSVIGQAEVITEALGAAGVSAREISYIEAHGTGTSLGDPIEIQALSRAFRADTADRGFCAIGSLKTNIGHLDTAAGIAGLIKVILSLGHRQIPASLHFEAPNPEIDFAASPVRVNRELCPWESPEGPRRAGISSFGIGGTNAHVVVQEAPGQAAAGKGREGDGPHRLILSARTAAALAETSRRLAAHLEAHPELPLADVAFTLAQGRHPFPERRELVCQNRDDAIRQLLAGGAPEPAGAAAEAPSPPETGRRVPLPTYPFARDRYWVEPPAGAAGALATGPGMATAGVTAGAAAGVTAGVTAAGAPGAAERISPPPEALVSLHPRPELGTPYLAPRGELEGAVAGVWRLLLGIDPIGVHDDFFELGGHSLLGTQILSHLARDLGVELPLQTLFDHPTVAELAEHFAAAGGARVAAPGETSRPGAPALAAPPTPVPPPTVVRHPLSFAQQRLWFIDRLEPGSPLYNEARAVRLSGTLAPGTLAAALAAVVRRHDVLRTHFREPGREDGGRPMAIVAPPGPVPLPVVDLSALPAPSRGELLPCLARAEARRGFDLARGPIFRARLLRLESAAGEGESGGGGEHILLYTVHHIASDGWSMGVLVREVAALYEAFSQGRPSPLPELAIQYGEHARRQREKLRDEVLEGQLAFWREALDGAPTFLDLPVDRPRPQTLSPRGATLPVTVSASLHAAVGELARSCRVTPFAVLLGAFQTLLSRWSGQTDLLVGSPVANRRQPEVEGLIGFFVNTLVLRGRLAGPGGGELTFAELLSQLRATTLAAFAHQDLPFERLVEAISPERDLSRPPLVQVVLALQNVPGGALDLPGLHLEILPSNADLAKFELTLSLSEVGARGTTALAGELEYVSDLFDTTTMRRFVEGFGRLLAGATAAPERRLGELPLLSPAQLQQLRLEWNDTAPAGATEEPQATIHALFAATAAARPEAIALVGEGETLSYGELSRRANRLACRLRQLGVGPEVAVGVALPRGPELITSLLAILASGGAYLPLDPVYPPERRAFLLADGGASVLVSSGGDPDLAASVPGLTVLDLRALEDALAALPTELAPERSTRENLAYLLYTSGSTGKPKGVAVPHRAIVRLVCQSDFLPFGPEETFLQLAPVAFDASTLEIWGPLLHGGRLVLFPPGLATPEELARTVAEHRVSTLWLTAGLFHQVVEGPWLSELSGLRHLLAGGDVLLPERVARVPRELPGTAMINGYGPTENTTFTTTFRVGETSVAPVPIGRPLGRTRIHVADRHLRPVPLGGVGELVTSGLGLARGYHARPGATAAAFVPDPWEETGSGPAGGAGNGGGGRLYRTGDRVRFLPGGALEFLGRIDTQVKIRGFRIELGEIEAALAEHPGVAAAVVVAGRAEAGRWQAGGGVAAEQLAAWIVPASPSSPPAAEELATSLSGRLPAYMVPAHFVVLPALPLTPNGKVDRRALPAPDLRGRGERAREERPRSAVERTLAGIWEELLGRTGIGLRDNFFDLGGHSLLLTRLLTRLRQEFPGPASRDLALVDLFRHPTLAALAERLTAEQGESASVRQGRERALARRHGLTREDLRIAIIGMAGRFPGAPDLGTYWQNLRDGVESILTLSAEEALARGADPETLAEPFFVPAVSLPPDYDRFDARFFGLSYREAELIDPQQRLLMEVAWSALEDAGYAGAGEHHNATGVFAGASLSTYLLVDLMGASEGLDPWQTVSFNLTDGAATRIAYHLDLRGPAVSVATACSTSLVAVHEACQNLLSGACDLALAGGASLPLAARAGYLHSPGSIVSPDGHCRAFSAAAAGTVFGGGAGVLVLKRYADAVADGDAIRAVILGSAVNNDGIEKVGFTAPGIPRQAAVVAEALTFAGLGAGEISYIEAHGTGTPLGDPIEVAALSEAFRADTDERSFCAIGSVKTNIGHLDTAAGAAGLIKTVLALGHRQIPPSLYAGELNPEIDWEASPLKVQRELGEWASPDGRPRRAGVSGFGIGGTNAHLIVEEAPAPAPPGPPRRPWQLLPLSARDEPALEAMTTALADHLEAHPELTASPGALADLAFTLQQGRRAFSHRRLLVCQSPEDVVPILRGEAPGLLTRGDRGEPREVPVAFLFSGQGSQYPGMGRELYGVEEAFTREIDRAAELLAPLLAAVGDGEGDLRRLLWPEEESAEAAARLTRTEIAQPALYAFEWALARQWMAWGIAPAALLGHSIGEYTAAAVAGVFSFEDGLTLVAERGRLMGSLPPGSMLAVSLPAADVEAQLGAVTAAGREQLAIAAINEPGRTVVSGPAGAVAALAEMLRASGVESRPLHTSHAFHSPMMEPILPAFRAAVAKVPLSPPRIPIVSNLSGTILLDEEATDPGYWAAHLRGAVRFADGISTLAADPERILLEVGPGDTLATLARATLTHTVPGANPGVERTVLASGRHPRRRGSDLAQLLTTFGRLWLAGREVDWDRLHTVASGVGEEEARENRRRLHLPTYPFQRQRCWIGTGRDSWTSGRGQGVAAPRALSVDSGLGRSRHSSDLSEWFYTPVWRQLLRPTVGDLGRLVSEAGPWLVLEDLGSSLPSGASGGVGAVLRERLVELGARVAVARPGEAFRALDDGTFELPPGEAGSYREILAALAARGEAPHRILHLWSLDIPAGDLEGARELGFYSVLYLLQALASRHQEEELSGDLTVVSAGLFDVSGNEELRPERALVLGLTKTAPLEFPPLRSRTIDLPLSVSIPSPFSPSGPGTAGDRRWVDQLLREAGEARGEVADEEVAVRGRWIWAQAFEALTLPAPEPSALPLREGGTYLITGGLGGIGLTLAASLVRQCRARLVLLSRRSLPPREEWPRLLAGEGGGDLEASVLEKLRQIEALEADGVEVLLLSVDVGDERAMAEARAEIHRQFGPVHGLIHAAGTAGGALLEVAGRETAEPVLRPKVEGTRVLIDTFAADRPDFVLLFSSMASLFPAVGRADYMGANAFLDAFAHNAPRRGGPPVLAINWDAWREVGMAVEAELPEQLQKVRDRGLREALASEEGSEAFRRLLASALPPTIVPVGLLPQVIVTRRDLLGVLETSHEPPSLAALEETPPDRELHPRPALATAYRVPASSVEARVVGFWEELLGVAPVGVDDDFFELGGHSLIGAQLINRLRESFSVDLPMQSLFESPTVAGVSAGLRELGVPDTPLPDRPLADASLAVEEGEGLREHVPLSSPTEERLAEIWGTILGRDGIGASDDFFELGGDEAAARRVLAVLGEEFNVHLPCETFEAGPTLAELALSLEEALLDLLEE